MEANEAPKKIYTRYMGYGVFDNPITIRTKVSQIEYIRKDAFIKKAIEFIQKHTSEIYSDYQMDKEDWIEDFKNHMEGE